MVFCDLLIDEPRLLSTVWPADAYRDTVIRKLTDLPVVGHSLRLRAPSAALPVPYRRMRSEVFAHNTSQLARPGWSTTRRCARYILGVDVRTSRARRGAVVACARTVTSELVAL